MKFKNWLLVIFSMFTSYEKLYKNGRIATLLRTLAEQGKSPSLLPSVIDPDIHEKVKLFLKKIDEANAHDEFATIMIGDSICDLSRKQLTVVKDHYNFAQCGYTVMSMIRLLELLIPELRKRNIRVIKVVVGCFGNNLLGYQYIDNMLAEMASLFNLIEREFCYASRIVIYGIPPVLDPYSTFNSILVEQYESNLCSSNKIYRLVSLKKLFGGFLGLFPLMRFSADTVHLTPRAQYLFDNALRKALL